MEKIFRQPKNSPTLIVLSHTMAEQAATSRIVSTRLGMIRECITTCGSHPSRAPRLYQSCVLSILLCGSECWRMTESDLNKLPIFQYKTLRRILHVVWHETILRSTSSHPLQPRKNRHHHHAKAMELELACNEKRAGRSPAQLSTRYESERTPGIKLWKESSKPSIASGGRFRSLPRTDSVAYFYCCPTFRTA